jgi:hypothetical protein
MEERRPVGAAGELVGVRRQHRDEEEHQQLQGRCERGIIIIIIIIIIIPSPAIR